MLWIRCHISGKPVSTDLSCTRTLYQPPGVAGGLRRDWGTAGGGPRWCELHSVGEKVGSREAQGEEPGELGSQPSLGLGFSPVLVTAEGAVSLPFPCNEGPCQSSRSFLEESLRPPALPHRPGVDAAPGLLAAPGSGPPARPAPPALCTHRNLLEPPAPPPRPSLPPPSSLCVLCAGSWSLRASPALGKRRCGLLSGSGPLPARCGRSSPSVSVRPPSVCWSRCRLCAQLQRCPLCGDGHEAGCALRFVIRLRRVLPNRAGLSVWVRGVLPCQRA